MALRVKNVSEILADDMCLGKTLTILALIMTKFYLWECSLMMSHIRVGRGVQKRDVVELDKVGR